MKYFFVFVAALLFLSLQSLAVEANNMGISNMNLSDAQILDVMQTANKGEINAAKLAISKAQNAEVKGFAMHMKEEHAKNLSDSKNVSKNDQIRPQSNPVSNEFKQDADTQLTGLQKATDANFDKAYIAGQIMAHRNLLDKLDNQLITNAQNADFKNYLKETRDHVQKHLAEAQKISQNL